MFMPGCTFRVLNGFVQRVVTLSEFKSGKDFQVIVAKWLLT